jgi:hypothetical protein
VWRFVSAEPFCAGRAAGFRFDDLGGACFFAIACLSKIDGQDNTDTRARRTLRTKTKAQMRRGPSRNALRFVHLSNCIRPSLINSSLALTHPVMIRQARP